MTAAVALPPIRRPSPSHLRFLASRITLEEQDTGERVMFAPSKAQMAFWEACARHPWLYAYKSRQVGFTTAALLEDVVFAAVNTEAGHSVEVWLVWDTYDKVAAKIELAHDFMVQLGITHRYREGLCDIIIPRGRGKPSRIRGITAGGKRAGAGLTAHRMHLSELPYWRDADSVWKSLAPAQNLSAQVVLETTMTAGSALARKLWDDPANPFHKLFCPVEDHEPYRANRVSEKEWEFAGLTFTVPADVDHWLRSEGFTRDDSIAFMAWALSAKAAGDKSGLLREYPQKPEHGFSHALGRWIRCRPEVLEHRNVAVPGDDDRKSEIGRTLVWKLFAETKDVSDQLIVSVDTSGAKGRSRSSVAAIDKRDERLVASWVDDGECTHREIARVAAHMWKFYSQGKATPALIVEDNGIGAATLHECRLLGAPARAFTATEKSKERALLLVKLRAEDGILKGPDELAIESDSLRREQVGGADGAIVWRGLKDLCMAIGNAYVTAEQSPYARPRTEVDSSTVLQLSKLLARNRRR